MFSLKKGICNSSVLINRPISILHGNRSTRFSFKTVATTATNLCFTQLFKKNAFVTFFNRK